MATRVIVDTRFDEYSQEVERAIDGALIATAERVETTAKAIAAPRRGLERRIRRTNPRRSRRGREIAVETDSVGYLQHKGTYRRLGAAKTKRGKKGGARGVKPLPFLRRALKAHRGDLGDQLARRLS